MTIIYIQAGWTTMFWNFLAWFQQSCIVTLYNCLTKQAKMNLLIPISTIDLCINIVRDLGLCYSGDRTQTHECLQVGAYSARQFIVKPIPENPKRNIS